MRFKKDIYHAAMYLRLSIEDDNRVESDSIQNQRELIKRYASEQRDIILTEEFVDDGYTGTNFERPGFQKMMDLVQKKVIDCIIVKDFSRLGRNYIDTGRYMEQIFPSLGVRFIAINDNYDSVSESSESNSIIVPFKNLINDAYCRDISIKIRSQIDIKRKNGKYIGSIPVYGYKKDPKDKSHLIIDEPAANIVRQIYDWKLEGYNPVKIADKLNDMGVLPPQEYKRSIGINSNCGYWRSENPIWVPRGVLHILKDEMYTGTMVQGKHIKINYKVNKFIRVDQKDWVRVPNTHEPIISRTIYDRMQEILQLDTRTAPNKKKIEPLSGMVFCADCGQVMTHRYTRSGMKKYYYYICSTRKGKKGCFPHSIKASYLEDAVLSTLQLHMKMLLEADDLFAKVQSWPKATHQVKIIEENIKSFEQEIDRYKGLSLSLYEDYKNGTITQNDYAELKVRFDEKIRQAMELRDKNIGQKIEMTEKPLLPPGWIQEIRKLGHIEKLTRKAVVMLLQKVIVYDSSKIEIILYYSDLVKIFIDEAAKLRREGL